MIPVDVPRCSYCLVSKGELHASFCTRPGLAREIAEAAKMAPRCAACGAPIVAGKCPSDWCPSTATERKAVDLGVSIGTAIGLGIRVAIYAALVAVVAASATVLWLVWRVWNGSL